MFAAAGSNFDRIAASVPQSAGERTPSGGGRCWPIETSQMKPSGVQFAMATIRPGGRRGQSDELARGFVIIGHEHHADGREHDIEGASGELKLWTSSTSNAIGSRSAAARS